MAITITKAAEGKIKSILKKRQTPDAFLRIAIKGGGCKHNGSRTQVRTNSDYLSCALQTVH